MEEVEDRGGGGAGGGREGAKRGDPARLEGQGTEYR